MGAPGTTGEASSAPVIGAAWVASATGAAFSAVSVIGLTSIGATGTGAASSAVSKIAATSIDAPGSGVATSAVSMTGAASIDALATVPASSRGFPLLLHRRLFRRRFRPDPLALHVLHHGIGGGVILHAFYDGALLARAHQEFTPYRDSRFYHARTGIQKDARTAETLGTLNLNRIHCACERCKAPLGRP